jgi:hypothetical protein
MSETLPEAPAPPPGWGTRLRDTARPLWVLVFACFFLHRYDTAPELARLELDRARSLTIALDALGLHADVNDVRFLADEDRLLSLTRYERSLVRARRARELSDIFLVRSRRAPDGSLLEISTYYNLTETSAAEERNLVVSESHAAWTIGQDGSSVNAVQLIDLSGEPSPTGLEWTRAARFQNALTNLQETGQTAGIGRRYFRLVPPAKRVVLGLGEDALLVDADSHRIRIDTNQGRKEGERLREITPRKARPGNLVTWGVDRVRALPWFGDQNVQLLKAVAFEAGDQLDQIVSTVSGESGDEAVAEELGDLYAAPTAAHTDPVTGWPPAALDPMFSPPLKGEGKWVELEQDPFVGKNPGVPCPFVVSFIRTDKKRIYSQIFITLWDPRQVELHAVSGTEEPKSATGETGSGEVPRKPEVMGRLVAAFNGGFQAMHGQFGMMAEGVTYLPPKPYAATVVELADGYTGFGTWPEKTPRVPENVLSMRQNMTPLIVDGVVNPYKRYWWGGLPEGWTQETRTVRSGLCLTKENFIAYFYGASVDPDVLGLAMQRARCVYGIHLDMNAGHTGLEFYRIARQGKLPNVGRPLEDLWEARGPVTGMPGFEFLGRRMIRLMALMNFPRYVGTQQRDFFYLTLRHILPGEPVPVALTPPEPGEGNFRVQGLTQHGWPPAIASTNLRGSVERPGARVGLIRLDPRALSARREASGTEKVVIAFRAPASGEGLDHAVWLGPSKGFVIGRDAPEPEASRISDGFLASDGMTREAQAAAGVDAGGMLLYARVTEGADSTRDAHLLREVLTRAGCKNVLLFPRPLGVELGSDKPATDLGSSATSDGTVLVRQESPGARRIFPETPIVGPKTWALLQAQRVTIPH